MSEKFSKYISGFLKNHNTAYVAKYYSEMEK